MRLDPPLVFWLSALAGAGFLLWLFGDVLLPFAAGFVLAYLLDPVASRLERLGLGRMAASLLLIGLFLLAFVVSLLALAPVLAHELGAFIEKAPEYWSRLQEITREQRAFLADRFGIERLRRLGPANGEANGAIDFAGQVLAGGGEWMAGLAGSLWAGGRAALGMLSLMVITPVVAFYMLVDWKRMIAALDAWTPANQRETVRTLAREIDGALAGFIRGQTLVCLCLGLWYAAGLSLVGLNFGLLVGAVAGVLSFIPLVGTLIAFVLAAGIALVQDWPDWRLLAMSMAVVGVGQVLEAYVLTPRLIGGAVGLHPLWIVFALVAAGSLFGFTGLLIAVPAAAIIGVLVRFALGRYLGSPLHHGAGGSGGAGGEGA